MKYHAPILFSFIMVISFQCEPETRYKVLNFFFDGVPLPPSMQAAEVDTTQSSLPDSSVRVSATRERGRQSEPTVYLHPPYKERKCAFCHETERGQRLMEVSADLICRNCHEEFNQDYRFVHGPVAVGACLRCHNPHSTRNPHLLTRQDNEVCTFCHEDLGHRPLPAHRNLDSEKCIQCHSPHYSNENRYFLVQNNRLQ